MVKDQGEYMKAEIIEWLKAIAWAVVIVFVIQIFVRPTTVVGPSMNTTLTDGDVLIIKVTDKLDRGDIVSFESDLLIRASDLEKIPVFKRLFIRENDKKHLIKRIIGIPGDTIKIEAGLVYRNGELLEEAYYTGMTFPEVAEVTVTENKYFVMGDNRNNSHDSRYEDIGLIDGEKITGKSIFRVWPITQFGSVE